MRRAIGLAIVLGAIGLGVWQIGERKRAESNSEPVFPPRDEIWAITMARFDGDGDGRLGREEFSRYSTPSLQFEHFDQDGDGFISARELDVQIMRREPRPLMDLRASEEDRPMVAPDRPVDDRPGRVP